MSVTFSGIWVPDGVVTKKPQGRISIAVLVIPISGKDRFEEGFLLLTFCFLIGVLLCGPGSDLLSHVLRRSTIGAGGLNGRVRDGIGWGTPAIATRSAKKNAEQIHLRVSG